jgi:hypothetical protein
MFRPNWPYSGVQVVLVKILLLTVMRFFLLLLLPLVILVMWVTISFIWVSLSYTWLLLILFSLLVVAALNVLAGGEFCFVFVGHHGFVRSIRPKRVVFNKETRRKNSE